MSSPAPGNYYIVNTVPNTFGGSKLAISYNGIDHALTVNPLDTTDATQVWTIGNYNSTWRFISPLIDATLQVASRDGYITVLPGNFYSWIISGDNGNYTIRDGKQSIFWFLEKPLQGDNVTYDAHPNSQTQYWWLYNY